MTNSHDSYAAGNMDRSLQSKSTRTMSSVKSDPYSGTSKHEKSHKEVITARPIRKLPTRSKSMEGAPQGALPHFVTPKRSTAKGSVGRDFVGGTRTPGRSSSGGSKGDHSAATPSKRRKPVPRTKSLEGDSQLVSHFVTPGRGPKGKVGLGMGSSKSCNGDPTGTRTDPRKIQADSCASLGYRDMGLPAARNDSPERVKPHVRKMSAGGYPDEDNERNINMTTIDEKKSTKRNKLPSRTKSMEEGSRLVSHLATPGRGPKGKAGLGISSSKSWAGEPARQSPRRKHADDCVSLGYEDMGMPAAATNNSPVDRVKPRVRRMSVGEYTENIGRSDVSDTGAPREGKASTDAARRKMSVSRSKSTEGPSRFAAAYATPKRAPKGKVGLGSQSYDGGHIRTQSKRQQAEECASPGYDYEDMGMPAARNDSPGRKTKPRIRRMSVGAYPEDAGRTHTSSSVPSIEMKESSEKRRKSVSRTKSMEGGSRMVSALATPGRGPKGKVGLGIGSSKSCNSAPTRTDPRRTRAEELDYGYEDMGLPAQASTESPRRTKNRVRRTSGDGHPEITGRNMDDSKMRSRQRPQLPQRSASGNYATGMRGAKPSTMGSSSASSRQRMRRSGSENNGSYMPSGGNSSMSKSHNHQNDSRSPMPRRRYSLVSGDETSLAKSSVQQGRSRSPDSRRRHSLIEGTERSKVRSRSQSRSRSRQSVSRPRSQSRSRTPNSRMSSSNRSGSFRAPMSASHHGNSSRRASSSRQGSSTRRGMSSSQRRATTTGYIDNSSSASSHRERYDDEQEFGMPQDVEIDEGMRISYTDQHAPVDTEIDEDDEILSVEEDEHENGSLKLADADSDKEISCQEQDDSQSDEHPKWICTCGNENEFEFNFCPMCANAKLWSCSVCPFRKNKCKFRYCGMCGEGKPDLAKPGDSPVQTKSEILAPAAVTA